ncbi:MULTISPECIES: NAD(P)H-binding protein [Methanobacterium]|uniref:NAD(P)H-binding protein n=1 Tax=Methanobacterium veterum TaxID=408577 RepID=A0A9E5DK33_9EURY|nr:MULTISPECIES: NAD(P)H-binding protein [Methanobacterium]MCZ3365189.1 NAD(P)H-binding protein [Methanobacterium veterum]MCZ3372944.1 NAD(P)H-binding protein [Methanobacterium veterum]
MKIIIFGATGMVGSEVVRQAIKKQDISEITAVVRNPLSIEDPKLKTIIKTDFLDYTDLIPVFKEVDACIWCLGISQNQVSKEEYEIITYEYAVAAAKTMLAANPAVTFVFLSGQGADSSEKSRILFARIKGKTENALKELNFKELYIARPGGIIPTYPQTNESILKKITLGFIKISGKLVPSTVITSKQLAQALLYVAEKGIDVITLDNKSLQKLSAN